MINKTFLSKRRAKRNRAKLKKTLNLRLSVFRSNKHIYVQLIDDEKAQTLLSSSSHEKDLKSKSSTQKEIAFKVGESIAEKIINKGIEKKILFDRGNYLYHGRIKELALGARSKGVKF